MATILPARRMYQIEYDYGLWWEQAGGGSIYPNSDILLVSSTGDQTTPTEYARSAIQFKTNVPTWSTVGSLTELNAVLWLYLEAYGYSGGIGNIQIAPITAAWNMSSSQVTMRSIATGAYSGAIAPSPNQERGWVGFDLGTNSSLLRSTHGICIKINTTLAGPSSFKFSRVPVPVGRAYLAINVLNAINVDAVDRASLDSSLLEAMKSSSPTYSLSARVKQEPIVPSRSDIPVTLGRDLQFNRNVPFPETWRMSVPSLGNLSFSLDVDLLPYRGSILETSLKVRSGQKAPVVIAKQNVILGEVDSTFSQQEVVTADPLKEMLSMVPYRRDPILGMENVQIDTESRLYAMLAVMINGAGIGWERIRQKDLYWLMLRFGSIWDRISKTAADMRSYTIDNFVQEIGAQYAIAISRGNDDSISIWHPAVYRPSLRVWEINDTEIANVHYKRKDGQDTYDIVKIQTTPVSLEDEFPTRLDSRDNIYSLSSLGGCFNSYQAARASLGKQLAQRLTCPYYTYEFTAGPVAAAWEVGDKLKITSKSNSFSNKVFTIIRISGKSVDGKYKIQAVHWPQSPGYQSTWQDTGLKGIWRFWKWDTWAKTGANQSPIGNAGSMTVTTFSDILHLDWRGVVGNADITAPATFAPDNGGGSSKYDLVDFILTLIGEQASDPTYGAGDPAWTNILRFEDSASNKAVYCGIHRVSAPKPTGTYYSSCDLRFFLGYTANKTTNPIVWSSKVESPPGFGNFTNPWTYGIAIQWHNNTVRLYVNQALMGAITVAGTNYNTVKLITPVGTEHKVGCLRWLQNQDDWFSPSQCVGAIGHDNYYP